MEKCYLSIINILNNESNNNEKYLHTLNKLNNDLNNNAKSFNYDCCKSLYKKYENKIALKKIIRLFFENCCSIIT